MATFVRAASNLLTGAKVPSLLGREGSAENTEDAVFTVVVSGTHGMLGSYLVDMFRHPWMRINGRPVRCRRLIRTRRSPGAAKRPPSSTTMYDAEAVGPRLPPRPEFLPSSADFVDAKERLEDAASEDAARKRDEADVKGRQKSQAGEEKADSATRSSAASGSPNEEKGSGRGTTVEEDIEEDDILWDIPGQWIETEKLEGVDAVIHLAGEPLAEKGEVAGERAPDRALLASSTSTAVTSLGAQLAETEASEAAGLPAAGSWGTSRLRSFLDSEEWLRSLGAWTEAKKQEIVDSRVRSCKLLADTFKRLQRPPKHFFVASGVGFYGIEKGDEICNEETSGGNTFVSEVSVQLEREAARAAPRQSAVFREFAFPLADLEKDDAAKQTPPRADDDSSGCRVVFLRFGVIFSTRGGILPRLLPLYKMRFGSRLGGGQQWMSWISLRDAARVIVFLLQAEQASIEGPVNVCSPEPMRNAELAARLHEVLHPNAWLTLTMPTPAALLRLVLGRLADEVLLGGQRVVPQRLAEAGFSFRHPSITEAIEWSLADKKRRDVKSAEAHQGEEEGLPEEAGETDDPEEAEERRAAFETLKSQQIVLAEQLKEQERQQEAKRHELLLKRRHSSKMMSQAPQEPEGGGEDAKRQVAAEEA
ncbi:NAD dependent epimerase/dehydratase family protein [Besnoitia besnoiti]|uniref:NAD dependent epimerase/dehydratase family protein n=1 Tax=Besnoitia besnoiti TaxID=94643 RepID=A0A2A9MPN2_BESBE|nr:NAD dependent epimerase/dehydratase family protein [Besnoitia besnoiti]PFH38326.1 NAD dependent epimerase/dehydratase family protein [Besnoitia besnoiti]